MDWFILFFIVMGSVVGIIPRLVMKNIKNAIELDYWERDKALNKANWWLLGYAWAIYITSLGALLQSDLLQDKDIKKLEQRIEALETPQQVDTVATQNDTINIKDVIYDTGRENSN